MPLAEIKRVPTGSIRPNQYNPNEMPPDVFDRLAGDIAADGDVDQPIIVREVSPGEYEIVDGEHRWRSAIAGALETVPVVVKNISDDEAKIMTVRRNSLRGDLNKEKFTALVKGLSNEARTVDKVRELMGLRDKEFAAKYAGMTAKTSTSADAIQSASEKNLAVSTLVANLSQMIRDIVLKHGDTVHLGYIAFGYKGETSLLVSMDSSLKKAMQEFVEAAKADGLTQEDLSARLAKALRDAC